MPSTNPASHGEGLTLRQAALVAGFAYLLNPVTFAEAYAYPKLVVPDNIGQTIHDQELSIPRRTSITALQHRQKEWRARLTELHFFGRGGNQTRSDYLF
jgi:hypothetical protein